MTDEPNPEPADKIRYDKPNSARVWNYWLGGKDNYHVDRLAGDAVIAINPDIRLFARQWRQFLIRAVRYLAGEAGIRQFLDIGTGLPNEQNTHEVAQAVAPDSKIVYVDNDALVLAHARALLTNTTPEGVTHYIHADVRDPEAIISDAHNTLNFHQPIAVMMLGILGHAAPAYDQARSIIDRLMAAVPSGSYLVWADGAITDDEVFLAGVRAQTEAGHPYHPFALDEFAEAVAGLELVDPGLVPVPEWRPDPIQVGAATRRSSLYCVVARKPADR
ncbi:MAG: SAM-dependent methyltransferase [Pseudonocardia sp.]|nr:SAM-dependent methyltransferase [Pseudonocardia sp.]